jgi:hypothetical protein
MTEAAASEEKAPEETMAEGPHPVPSPEAVPDPQTGDPAPPEDSRRGVVHLTPDAIELRLTDHSFHRIELAELSAQGDPVALLLYALVIQAFDFTRGLMAVAQNTGASAKVLHLIAVAATKRQAQQGPDPAVLATYDAMIERFEKRLGIKVAR